VLIIASVLAVAGLALASVAVAGTSGRHHRQPARTARHRIARHRFRRTFAPVVIRRAAEVSAVQLDPITQQFMQVTFDRGWVTQVSDGSISLQQKQNGAVWRTQSFTVPSGAVVTLNSRTASLSDIPTGAAARIESSGPVGGSLSVVRVNAYTLRRNAPLPTTSSS
jgi:hypothetical protein